MAPHLHEHFAQGGVKCGIKTGCLPARGQEVDGVLFPPFYIHIL